MRVKLVPSYIIKQWDGDPQSCRKYFKDFRDKSQVWSESAVVKPQEAHHWSGVRVVETIRPIFDFPTSSYRLARAGETTKEYRRHANTIFYSRVVTSPLGPLKWVSPHSVIFPTLLIIQCFIRIGYEVLNIQVGGLSYESFTVLAPLVGAIALPGENVTTATVSNLEKSLSEGTPHDAVDDRIYTCVHCSGC